jgi:serine/threonine protein kinase
LASSAWTLRWGQWSNHPTTKNMTRLFKSKKLFTSASKSMAVMQGFCDTLGPCESGFRIEFASNYGLRKHIQDHGSEIPLEQRLRWCQQIADALAFAHSKGVIHGDLEWANIFLDEDLNAKVGDFAGSSLDGSPLMVAVTPSHRYPGLLLSKRADIFALGSTMVEVLCGQTPYEGCTDKEIKDLFDKSKFPETKHLGPVGTIIAGCWEGKLTSADEVSESIDGISFLFKICGLSNHMFSCSISKQSFPKYSFPSHDNNINDRDIGIWVARSHLGWKISTPAITLPLNMPSALRAFLSSYRSTPSLHNFSVFPFH